MNVKRMWMWLVLGGLVLIGMFYSMYHGFVVHGLYHGGTH